MGIPAFSSKVSNSFPTKQKPTKKLFSKMPAAKSVAKASPKKAAPARPPYKQMFADTLKGQGRKGLSLIAISKMISAEQKNLGPRHETSLKLALKRGIEDGSVVKVKGVGLAGSFKLPAPVKAAPAAKKAPAKKAAAKKPAAKKAPAKKAAAKKTVVVKKAAKKPAAKKPAAKKTAKKTGKK